jgi:hypothetical protein
MVRFLLPFLLLATPAHAVEVIFFGIQRPSGEWIELERGSRFVHLAVSYEGGWLHAHPLTGVDVSYDLKPFGKVIAHLQNHDLPDPAAEDVEPWLGLPYDSHYRWNDEAFYCSELVGKLFGLKPRPQDFSAPVWRGRIPSTDLGISPQGVYNDLIQAGWVARPL